MANKEQNRKEVRNEKIKAYGEIPMAAYEKGIEKGIAMGQILKEHNMKTQNTQNTKQDKQEKQESKKAKKEWCDSWTPEEMQAFVNNCEVIRITP